MAKVNRVSGKLKIELSYNDRTDQYKAKICPMVRGEKCETVYVGSNYGARSSSSYGKKRGQAVDSAAAYTSAAHAAISFARDDIQQYADTTRSGSGWLVRKPRPARRR